MSEIIEFKASGEKDQCCITPEEIVRFCIKHNVDRINSMFNIWKIKITDEDGEVAEEFGDIRTVMETKESTRKTCKVEITPTNKWEFDIN